MSSTPRQLKSRRVDNDALQVTIRRQRAEIGQSDIRTRSQQRLERSEEERAELEEKQRDIREQIVATEKNLADLADLLTAQKAVDADLSIDLNAVQETIHALRQSGVTI